MTARTKSSPLLVVSLDRKPAKTCGAVPAIKMCGRVGAALHGIHGASNPSIESALKPAKLYQGIRKDVATSAANSLSNASAWISRAPAAAFRSERPRLRAAWTWLWGGLPTGSVASCNRQPSESGVVHDHIRLRQHQIAAVACIGLRIRTRHVKHASPTESGETVGGSSCGGELSLGWGLDQDDQRQLLVLLSLRSCLASARTCCHRPSRDGFGGLVRR